MKILDIIEKKVLIAIPLFLIAFFAVILLPLILKDNYNRKLMCEQGVDTECVMTAYGEGRTGVRGPKKGYSNQFMYYIGDSIHYCYVFTSVKPLPFDMRLKVRYLQKKDGTIIINFPDEYKETYKEYGFNDYGY
ncbi:MAG: hypothetical protein LBN95_02075 [Prevotellaceae bacterium]|jgi:hypothetical protein|nr:hypothetical protein [Prevotellaceae bacterium]